MVVNNIRMTWGEDDTRSEGRGHVRSVVHVGGSHHRVGYIVGRVVHVVGRVHVAEGIRGLVRVVSTVVIGWVSAGVHGRVSVVNGGIVGLG